MTPVQPGRCRAWQWLVVAKNREHDFENSSGFRHDAIPPLKLSR
jgi:hypothetical protein